MPGKNRNVSMRSQDSGALQVSAFVYFMFTRKGPVTDYGEVGGLQNGGGGGDGACEVLPLYKGVGKSFSHAEGGTTCFGLVFTQ